VRNATDFEPGELFEAIIDTVPILAWTARPDGSGDFLQDHGATTARSTRAFDPFIIGRRPPPVDGCGSPRDPLSAVL
jgi:hypothetical protein